MGPAERQLATIIGGYVIQLASLLAERDALAAQVAELEKPAPTAAPEGKDGG